MISIKKYLILFLTIFFIFMLGEFIIISASPLDSVIDGIYSFRDNNEFHLKGIITVPNNDTGIESDTGIGIEAINKKEYNQTKNSHQLTISPHSFQYGFKKYFLEPFNYAPALIKNNITYFEGIIARKSYPNFLANTYGGYIGTVFPQVFNLDLAIGYEVWPGVNNDDSSLPGSAFYRFSFSYQF